MIPPFDERGYLPQGIYEPTWDEFWERFGTNNYRKQLLTGLRLALGNLKLAGCRRVYIGGSFITDKERPNDYDGCFDIFGIDEDAIESRLSTAGLADPDLLIRTGGEYRVSNFLLYQLAYTELYVTPIYWPEFNAKTFALALSKFNDRSRRFGA